MIDSLSEEQALNPATSDESACFMSVDKLSGPVTIPEAINVEFAERVAFMAIYPFIREHVFGIATRLKHPAPVLGLVRQGGFKLTAGEPG